MAKRLKSTDIKMLATVGENGAPIAVPLCCLMVWPAKEKVVVDAKVQKSCDEVGIKRYK